MSVRKSEGIEMIKIIYIISTIIFYYIMVKISKYRDLFFSCILIVFAFKGSIISTKIFLDAFSKKSTSLLDLWIICSAYCRVGVIILAILIFFINGYFRYRKEKLEKSAEISFKTIKPFILLDCSAFKIRQKGILYSGKRIRGKTFVDHCLIYGLIQSSNKRHEATIKRYQQLEINKKLLLELKQRADEELQDSLNEMERGKKI